MRTAIPTLTTHRMPFTLDPHAQAIMTPVDINQNHHICVNSLQVCQHRKYLERICDAQVAVLHELDVAVHGGCDEEDEGRVKKDETALRDVRVV